MNRTIVATVALGLSLGGTAVAGDDPFLWLEDIEGEKVLDWARQQNERSETHLQAHEAFDEIHRRNLEILTSEDRIAYPNLQGGAIYNFWRDANHVRGIWRRTSLESYRGERPDWQVMLDIDQLAEQEEQNWVWAGSSCRYPDYDRCLVGLSIGGADAAVRREFDLESGKFVAGGFELPESKSQVSWRDLDSVFLGPAFSDEDVTDSGYARTVRLWQRGTSHEEAELIYSGERSDVGVFASRTWDGETPYDFIARVPTFFTRVYYLYRDGEAHRLTVPLDAELSIILDGQLLLQLKSDWTLGETTFRQGALVAGPVESFLTDSPKLEVVIAPDERSSIAAVSQTQGSVLVNMLDNVVSRVFRFTHDADGWHQQELDVPALGSISIVTTDDRSERFFFNYTGFLTPSSLYEADAATGRSTRVRSEPRWFDSTGMSATQYEATSADGEKIPYFVVKPKGFEANGANPTLLYAYGGFEVPMRPGYSGVLGSAWLERGGVYVLANIRGGGEFGPRWHQAALRENRQRSFDDLIAVAEDLVERGITSPQNLGIRGGSNGGLLVGAVMVQRPDLFNAVVCQVPLLDMRRYHLLLAGASWMAEFGNPDDPADWEFISQYSPYQKLSADADYPVPFITTSTRDDRVHPGHARKMVARMKEQGHDVLYYENIEGGHGGAANLKQSAYINALIYAYLLERLTTPPAED